MSHPRCVYMNNRCRYQSITQQYLKRCLIKDDSNYMFRPIAAIIRFSSESMMVVLYRIGMAMSRWWDLIIRDVCYMLLLRDTGGREVICYVRYLGVYSRDTWAVHPKIAHITDNHPEPQCPLTIAYNKHHGWCDLTIVTVGNCRIVKWQSQ